MSGFKPIWSQVTLTVEHLAAIASAEEVLSPDSSLGEVGREQIRLEIPTFQRGLRWKESKRQDFLSSLYAGLPIGSLVLARKPDSEQNGVRVKNWLVLDGQQRISSLRILHTSFWKSARYNIGPFRGELAILANAIFDEDSETAVILVAEELEKVLSSVSATNQSLLDESRELLRRLFVQCNKEYPNASPELEDQLLRACTQIRKSLSAQYDALKNYPVPVLLVTPNRSSTNDEQMNTLAQVFTVLNSYTPLSRYELIAAQWANRVVHWPSDVDSHVEKYMKSLISSRISETYEAQQEDFEYDTNIEERDDGKVGLFDILYALSRSTSDKVNPPQGRHGQGYVLQPRLVLKLGSSALSDIAFEIVGLFLLKKKPTDLQKIAENIPVGRLNLLLVDDLIESYLASCDFLESSLRDIVGVDNFRNRKPIGLIQAIVYLTNIIALQRDSKFKPATDKLSPHNEPEITRLSALKRWRTNATAWWLYDILGDHFQGADANTNAVRRVWQSNSPALTMLNPPSLHDFARVFVLTFNEESRPLDRAPQRRRISDKARAILFAAFAGEQLTEQGEQDHVVPWKHKGGNHPRLAEPLPLNHVANWMPLEETINASRGNKPWKDYFPTLTNPQQSRIKPRLLLPVNLFTPASAYSVDTFLSLMVKRYLLMVDRCLSNLKVGEYTEMSSGNKLSWLDENIRTHLVAALQSEGRSIDDEETRISEDLLAN